MAYSKETYERAIEQLEGNGSSHHTELIAWFKSEIEKNEKKATA